MAGRKKSESPRPWIKSDEIFVDTSKAPWMEYANAELGKKVHELGADDAFITALRVSLAVHRSLTVQLLDKPPDNPRFNLGVTKLRNPADQFVGKLEAAKLQERNPEINKYFKGVKTDPSYSKKGRSDDVSPTYESDGYGGITPWCAAFVNWCLTQAGVPHLGYATAKSWLEFGTPVAAPVYGCITVIKPSASTGSTTGHVAFYVKSKGNNVVLLGGNQGDWVSEVPFRQDRVLGYRWPTKINHYLLAGTGVVV